MPADVAVILVERAVDDGGADLKHQMSATGRPPHLLLRPIRRCSSRCTAPYDEQSRTQLKSDVPRLRRRARILTGAVRLALASGVCTGLPLAVVFASAFLGLEHACGASLFKFGQEVAMRLSEADHHR